MQLIKELKDPDRRFTRHELSTLAKHINNLHTVLPADTAYFGGSQYKGSRCDGALQKTVPNFNKQTTAFNLELHLRVNILPKRKKETV